MSGIMMSSPLLVFADSTKGDIANRMECSKEHIKNDIGYLLKGGTAAAVTAGAVIGATKPSILKNLSADAFAKTSGVAGKFAEKVAQSTPNNVKNIFAKATDKNTLKEILKKIGTTTKNTINKVSQKVKVPPTIKDIAKKAGVGIKNVINKIGSAIGQGVKKVMPNIKVPAFMSKVANAIKNIKLSGPAKIFAAVAAIGATAFAIFTAKWLNKKGQIDQKYTDMANIKNHVTNLYRPVLK